MCRNTNSVRQGSLADLGYFFALLLTIFQNQLFRTLLHTKMVTWRHQLVGGEDMKVAVMGCEVNGPGESKHANIRISLPGTGEAPSAPVFVDGKKVKTLKGENIA